MMPVIINNLRVGILLKRRENSSDEFLILEKSSCLLQVRINALGEQNFVRELLMYTCGNNLSTSVF